MDADDAVQETMLRAWRSLERFEGRASLRTWLYRIATNVCFDTLAERARRERPIETGPPPTVSDALPERPRTRWLEADLEARALSSDVDPAELAALRESIRLAFLAALTAPPAEAAGRSASHRSPRLVRRRDCGQARPGSDCDQVR